MTRTVLVTGAAAGIGRATATRFARAGYRVGAFDVDEAGLQSLRSDSVLGEDALVGRLDVRDPEQWRAALETLTASTEGRLDVLVNNAGLLRAGPFAQIPLADQQRLVEVNVTGVLNGCHVAYPYLAAAPGAHVVNLCSASAIYGQAELATYGATKSAVRGLTEALDLEWAADDITVRALWPLFVDTGMVHGVDTGSIRSLGVRLTADDVAAAVLQTVGSTGRTAGGVHRAVGRQARLMLASSGLTPSWALRLVNKRIAAGQGIAGRR